MINDSQIEQIAKATGLANCRINSIGSGHYNDSYYIDSKEGRFVLRIAPADDVPKLFYEVDMIHSEPEIHKLVKEKTDIPIPQIVFYDFSRKLIDRDFLVMEYLEGKPGLLDEKKLGEYVRGLHEIKGIKFGYPDRVAPMGDNWPEIFKKYVELIFKDCLSCGAIDEDEHNWFLSIYEKNYASVVDVEPHLLHLDLWYQNILTVDGKITGILDFDRGLYGDVELEFAVLDTYGYSSGDFFAGYNWPRPDYKDAQIRQRLYIVYELIKYAFIRLARGKSRSIARSHVEQCRKILGGLG